MPDSNPLEKRRVWSWPLRLFHWALVVSVAGGWYLGDTRSFTTIELHFYFGYATLALIAARLLWGLFGPRQERLGALVTGPGRFVAYLRGLGQRAPSGVVGHNPLGGLSVVAMLLVLTVQAGTGLFAEDDTLFAEGPFAGLVASDLRLTLTAIHGWTAQILAGLVVLHLAAILFYAFWKREDLVRPMVTGWKWVRRDE